jgi:UDP-N-acetylmuramate--alanine ligase
LASEFAAALRSADMVVLTDIYAASEPRIEGVDRRTIGAPLEELGGNVHYCAVGDLPAYLQQHAPPGALVLMLGAGDITCAAANLARALDPQLVAR